MFLPKNSTEDSEKDNNENHNFMMIMTMQNISKVVQSSNHINNYLEMQKSPYLLATKERPEIDPELGMIINADVMQIIESKREKEPNYESGNLIKRNINETGKANDSKKMGKIKIMKHDPLLDDSVSIKADEQLSKEKFTNLQGYEGLTTPSPPQIRKSRMNQRDEDDIMAVDYNDHNNKTNSSIIGLVNKYDSLEAAGSEMHQKQKLQIKKGADGKDYDYDYYYYYYYDEDEDPTTNTTILKSENNVNHEESNDNSKKNPSSNESITNNRSNNNKKNNEKKYLASSLLLSLSSSQSQNNENSSARGKSRYANVDRNNNSVSALNANDLSFNGKQQQKSGRSSIPVTEQVDEERLPAITRFPPRNSKTQDNNEQINSFSGQQTPSVDVVINKKHHVKRPSLDLIDSETFNTDDKQSKNNRNNIENIMGGPSSSLQVIQQTTQPVPRDSVELSSLDKPSVKSAKLGKQSKSVVKTNDEGEVDGERKTQNPNFGKDTFDDVYVSNKVYSNTALLDTNTYKLDIENTTPFMEKVAFDLYAILANENLNSDILVETTENSVISNDIGETTINPNDGKENGDFEANNENDGTDNDENKEDVGENIPDELTTTTATTSSAPTTPKSTTSKTSKTTTTTITVGSKRGGVGRNRFRISKIIPSPAVETSVSITQDHFMTVEPGRQVQKGKNRFERPSFTRMRTLSSTESSSAKERLVSNDNSKPVHSSIGVRDKARNRFTLRGTSTTTATASTTERNNNLNLGDAEKQNEHHLNTNSIYRGNLRPRPTLSLRSRTKPLGSNQSTSTTTTSINDNTYSTNDNDIITKNSDKKFQAGNLPTRPSRFNLNRASIQTAGTNKRLPLPRGRLNAASQKPLLTSTVTGILAGSSEKLKFNESNNDEDDKKVPLFKNNDDALIIDSTTVGMPLSGLNRLKNRPRIHVQNNNSKKLKTPTQLQINRKVNPLIAKRKLQISVLNAGSASNPSSETSSGESELESVSKKYESGIQQDEQIFNETTEQTNIELTSEQSIRGLGGFLNQRKRLSLRKPGTIL